MKHPVITLNGKTLFIDPAGRSKPQPHIDEAIRLFKQTGKCEMDGFRMMLESKNHILVEAQAKADKNGMVNVPGAVDKVESAFMKKLSQSPALNEFLSNKYMRFRVTIPMNGTPEKPPTKGGAPKK